MYFKILGKSKKGLYIWFGNMVFHIDWSASGLWSEDHNGICRTDLISFMFLRKKIEFKTIRALMFIVGPLKVMIGIK